MPEMPKIFWEIHSNLPRQGPGDNESTRKAYALLKDLPKEPRILDIGCGPGMQTVELAKISHGKIDALDNHRPFLDELKQKVEKETLHKRVKIIPGDMCNLGYENGSFDLIWSEGAIFIIGFEKGLKEWKRLLTKEGYLVVSELSWITNDPPQKAKTYMKKVYPFIKNIIDNVQTAHKSGYRMIGFFILPEKSWWNNYYTAIEKKLPALKSKHRNNRENRQAIASEEEEIQMFRNYSNYYGYVFYIMQNS